MDKKYTPKEIRFLEKKVTGRRWSEITELFNKRFGLALSESKIKDVCRYHGLHNGRKAEPVRPVGSERVESDGYTTVKTAGPNIWKHKHLVIWEAANGKLPKGGLVIFADGNKMNMELDNLLLISRRELCLMNRYGYFTADKDLTKAGKLVADIQLLINERKRESAKRNGRTT